jgi:hypothetical protein
MATNLVSNNMGTSGFLINGFFAPFIPPSLAVNYGVVYVMDHEVIPCYPKVCDWPLNLSSGHFSLYQGQKICKRDSLSKDLQKAYFQAYIIQCHGSTCFAVKEVHSLQK